MFQPTRPPVGVERMLRIYFLQRPRAKRLVPQVDAAQAAA